MIGSKWPVSLIFISIQFGAKCARALEQKSCREALPWSSGAVESWSTGRTNYSTAPLLLYSTSALLHEWLLADLQAPQQIEIQLGINPLDVVQQPAPPADHPQQAPPAGEVLGVQLQVLGHLGDATGEQRNLDLRRTRVRVAASK